MKIHMIGHASIIVETADVRIIMDPVLWDPHQEGLFDVNPKREVLHEKLPDCQILVLSHRHLDHFDIRSLAYLPKSLTVFIPCDGLLEKYLRELGYEKIRQLRDFAEVGIRGSTRLFTTRSENNVPEFGLVVQDESGTLWNQVDSVVSSQTVQRVLTRFPQIDFLLASWQPMLEVNFQSNSGTSFPATRYSEILRNIVITHPKSLAPGANAFCYRGSAVWLNHVVFPMDRDRFLFDAKLALPSIADSTFSFLPGDVVQIDRGTGTKHDQACPFVLRTGYCADLTFSPVTVNATLIDENPDSVQPETLEDRTRTTVEEIDRSIVNDPNLYLLHRHKGVIYQLQVVFPDGQSKKWHVDFTAQSSRVRQGANPLANVFTVITSSCLNSIAEGRRGWDYALLGGHCRSFNHLYAVTPQGAIVLEWQDSLDPLRIVYPFETVCKRVLDRDVEQWGNRLTGVAQ